MNKVKLKFVDYKKPETALPKRYFKEDIKVFTFL